MPRRVRRRPTLGLPALLLIAGCGGGAGAAATADPSGPPPDRSSPTSDALSASEIEALFHARIEGARTRFTEADVRFMTAMIHHHAQAIEISLLAPLNDADPTIRTLAARIVNAQQDEITTMKRWLEDRGQPVPGIQDAGGDPTDHGHHHHHGDAMPGMLTESQVQRLAESRGKDFDRLFLTLMIEHHRGAVTMVHELFATDGAAQDEEVFRFASDVQVDQATEVARMERMLRSLSSGDGGSSPASAYRPSS